MEKFLSLFHRYGYIYRPFGGAGWVSANEKWQLTDTEILKAIACVHPKHFLGCRAGRASKFAVLDIDAGSRYHNLVSLKNIQGLLAQAGIAETNLYRSSESGGWHLYIFFDSLISSRDLRAQLYQLFKLHGYEINKGTLEIFPHPGDRSLGQGLRLPLQEGWAWLNDETLAVRADRSELTPAEALLDFLSDQECSVNSHHQFHQLKAFVEKAAATRETIVARTANATKLAEVIPIRNSVSPESSEEAVAVVKAVFQKLPPGIIADAWLRGRNYYYVGLTGPSQRADAIQSLSHYLFYGDPERLISAMGYGYESERQWVIEEVLKTKHHGFSKDLVKHQKDSLKHAERAAKWVPPHRRGKESTKYEFEVPVSWQRGNANRSARARQKIMVAVEDFREAGRPFSMRDLWLKSGCGVDTLRKHEDLWKAVQTELQTGFLAGDPGEYNAGVGAACSESKPPDQFDQKSAPPGLLAARRVVYELKMRADRLDMQKHHASARGEKVAEERWRDGVALLIEKDVSGASPGQLKIQIALLARELLIAPTEEDCFQIRNKLEEVRGFLARGSVVQLWLDVADSS
ncbi:MAG: hypothetical protein JSS83_23220 [Cyanobacteria bacterium SZAS LIN-3]|nr:hypothetical protein [Cyanobacteria bacterium SZAS LIN-3]